jgi:hypothetical protein
MGGDGRAQITQQLMSWESVSSVAGGLVLSSSFFWRARYLIRAWSGVTGLDSELANVWTWVIK